MDHRGRPIDPSDSLSNCVTDVITIMLIGETISQEKINEVTEALHRTSKILGPGVGIFLDWFPFLRFFGNKTYKILQSQVELQHSIINAWMNQHPTDGFISVVQAMSEKEKAVNFLSEKAQAATAWTLLVTGMLTTSNTLTCLMNTLSHYPHVQVKLQKEIMEVIGPSRHPTLKDQHDMPYLRATILEIERFASIAPFGLPHKSVETCQLDEYTIPKDTEVWVNLWALHHDEKLWDEPFSFAPERFLDADGNLVPADHPNCKNTMPFGAGHRVCVGEVLAVSRMFLITARILQNFTVLPESTVENQPSCDPRDMRIGAMLLPPAYKVRMMPLTD